MTPRALDSTGLPIEVGDRVRWRTDPTVGRVTRRAANRVTVRWSTGAVSARLFDRDLAVVSVEQDGSEAPGVAHWIARRRNPPRPW